MAKFKSYDGIDKDGVRAEVVVQTGSGRIKELLPKGQARPDGSYRNLEVVFDPDNPHLKRKVYANLDTTSKEIYEKVKSAHENGETVEYRIESVRRRNVDRGKPFEDLKYTEEVVRILAAIDDVFSDEARTDPQEDEVTSSQTPSALQQRLEQEKTHDAPVSSTAGQLREKFNVEQLIKHLQSAQAATPTVAVFEALQGALLSQGELGLSKDEFHSIINEGDGSGYGTPEMALMIDVEKFTMKLLKVRYGTAKDESFAEEIFTQSTAASEEILKMADSVYHNINDNIEEKLTYYRTTSAYRNVLEVVKDTISHRGGIPLLNNEESYSAWNDSITTIAQERLEMMKLVINGMDTLKQDGQDKFSAPDKLAEVDEVGQILKTVSDYEYQPSQHPESGNNDYHQVPHVEHLSEVEPPQSAPEPPHIVEGLTTNDSEAPELPPTPSNFLENQDVGSYDNLSTLTSNDSGDLSSISAITYPDFKTTQSEFIAPSSELVMSLKTLCEQADVLNEKTAIVEWLNFHLGKRKAQDVNSENLERFIAFYQNEGLELVRKDVLSFKY